MTGYDIAPYAVDASLKRGVRTIQADVTSLQIAGGSQDFVVSLDVIEHIEHRSVLLNEINWILKPGGKALITVPAHMWLWSNYDVLNHHFRRYSKGELISDIRQSGFEILSIRW